MRLLSSALKNKVLERVALQLNDRRHEIIQANKKDLSNWVRDDQALYDRLVVNEKKVDEMIAAVKAIREDADPVDIELSRFSHHNGLEIVNRSAPFGTVLIIYESRPDVTIEAASVAFKSNNKILLKGGKEAIESNRILTDCWHRALVESNLSQDWVKLLEWNRQETQDFLMTPDIKIDLIVPRGGDRLIEFVKTYASCPVLVSGRGNNFLYVHNDANWEKALPIIINAKVDKISACNALDKVLIHQQLPDLKLKLIQLIKSLQDCDVEVLMSQELENDVQLEEIRFTEITEQWDVEYLALKIAIGIVEDENEAIHIINKYSGGHSVSAITQSKSLAKKFMEEVDAAAVYHNASTRFTDGGQFGLGAELAISTDKLHHRGPLGLQQLVTNKWFVFGDGQIR